MVSPQGSWVGSDSVQGPDSKTLDWDSFKSIYTLDFGLAQGNSGGFCRPGRKFRGNAKSGDSPGVNLHNSSDFRSMEFMAGWTGSVPIGIDDTVNLDVLLPFIEVKPCL
jgi:hypothetical protein